MRHRGGSSQPNKWEIETDPKRKTERVRKQEKQEPEIERSTANTAHSEIEKRVGSKKGRERERRHSPHWAGPILQRKKGG